jgi:hypothetical protein
MRMMTISNDEDNLVCMEQESDTGTTYWYQMLNCNKRANIAYSFYPGNIFSSSKFKEAVCIL